MQFFKQQRALGFARASLIIGICIIPAYLPVAFCGAMFQLYALRWVLYAFPIAAITGLVLGVIGLTGSIRKESRSTKGIVLATIGIALTLAEAAITVCILLSV